MYVPVSGRPNVTRKLLVLADLTSRSRERMTTQSVTEVLCMVYTCSKMSGNGRSTTGYETISPTLSIEGQALIADGSAAAPSLAFISDEKSGLYKSGSTIRTSIAGVDVATQASNGLTLSGSLTAASGNVIGSTVIASSSIRAAVGSQSQPALSFGGISQTASGLWYSTSSGVHVSIAGVSKFAVGATSVSVGPQLLAGDLSCSGTVSMTGACTLGACTVGSLVSSGSIQGGQTNVGTVFCSAMINSGTASCTGLNCSGTLSASSITTSGSCGLGGSLSCSSIATGSVLCGPVNNRQEPRASARRPSPERSVAGRTARPAGLSAARR